MIEKKLLKNLVFFDFRSDLEPDPYQHKRDTKHWTIVLEPEFFWFQDVTARVGR